MDIKFDQEDTKKLIMGMIKEEGDRILSSNLADKDEYLKFINACFNAAGKSKKRDNLLETLSFLHKNLYSIKLPGDFKKVADGAQEELILIFDLPNEEVCEVQEPIEVLEVKEDSKKSEKKDEKDEEDKDEGKYKDEDKKDDFIDQEQKKILELANQIAVEQLQKIAYDFGSKGEHKEAYAIEKVIKEIIK